MTHFAAVAPLSIHKGIHEYCLGTYQLLIASVILKDIDNYSAFWQSKLPDQYIMVDNGVIEEGFPLPMEYLVRAAKAVEANCIILPDTIDDARMTVKLATVAVREYRSLEADGRELMGVVQGESLSECFACASDLINLGVDRLAVPRGLTKNLGSRIHLVATLANIYRGVPIHLLGFSDNIPDDILAAVQAGVVGIDAATPVWLGLQGIELPGEPPADSSKWGHRPDYFWTADSDANDDDGMHYETAMIERNIGTVSKWLSDAASRNRNG